MGYLKDLYRFINKLNKKSTPYVISDEVITLEAGKWEGFLNHDNVLEQTIEIYTQPNKQGSRILNYTIELKDETWKTFIRVFHRANTLYITYETLGDTVEAEDINNLQWAIDKLDVELEETTSNLNKHTSNSEIHIIQAERTRWNNKIDRSELELINELLNNHKTNQLNPHNVTKEQLQLERVDNVQQASKEEFILHKDNNSNPHNVNKNQVGLDNVDNIKQASKTDFDNHVSDTISHITSAERTLWNTVSNKVDKETGKGLSTNDYTTTEKNKLAGIANNANNYVHPTSHAPSIISQDANNRFVTDTEKATWNAKASTSTATTSSNGLMSSTDKSKLNGIAANATKTEASTTNGKVKINGTETTVYTHPTGTNPHGTTKSDVGLSNVDNTSDLNKPISTAVQTALNGKANSSHTHDDRYYTESEIDTKLNGKANSSHTHSQYVTKDDLGGAGYGDMMRSVYDTNGNGVVDKAESVAWTGVAGKPSTFPPSNHTHSNYTTRINLTGQCQKTSYRKSVIALCKTSGTNTSLNSYSIGSLYLHRTNGLEGAINVDVSVECQYGRDGHINASIIDNSFSNKTKGGIRPCTFTYKGINYGGIEIYIAEAELAYIEFNGTSNFDIFALDYYQTNLSTPSLIGEITNSISYDKVSNTGNFRFNGHKVYHEGNKPTASDVGALPKTGITWNNLKGV